jgi:hypothetical protein
VGKARRRSGSRNIHVSRAHLPVEAAISLFLVFGHHGTKFFNRQGGNVYRGCRRIPFIVWYLHDVLDSKEEFESSIPNSVGYALESNKFMYFDLWAGLT